MLLFLTVIVILLAWYLCNLAKVKHDNFPPGPPKLAIWGSYWYLLRENYNFFHLAAIASAKRYKTDILGLYLGDTPTVITFSNELSKEMLTREEFIGRNDTIVNRTRSFGELKGIFFADGLFWKEERRFSLRLMRDYGFGRRSVALEEFVAAEVRHMIEFLQNDPAPKDANMCKKKGVVLMPDFVYGPLSNIILSILASTQFDHHELQECARRQQKFLRHSDPSGCALSITPWLRFIAPGFFGYTSVVEDNGYLQNFLKVVLDDHMKTYSDDHHRDFIDEYISQKKSGNLTLDYQQLQMLILDYMFPAPIAIGETLNFIIAHLINYPHVQRKIQDEIDTIVGESRLPNLDDRKFMPYTEASIREALRIFPLNPLGIPRRCIKDTTLGGYFIPKDTIMMACTFSAHRDEKFFPDPEEFRPERFLNSDGNLLKRDYTIPFGAGKRLCAGETFARQNVFLIITGLLQNFTLTSPTGERIPLNVVPGVNMSMKEMWIAAVPRQIKQT